MSDLEPRSGREEPHEDLPLAPHESGPALARNPLAEVFDVDPLMEQLDALESLHRSGPRTAPKSAADPVRKPGGKPQRPGEEPPTPLPRRRWVSAPSLDEVELPEPEAWLDHLIDEPARRALAALTQLVDGDRPYDHFGFSPQVMKRAFPFFYALHRLWFRVASQGHANLPTHGPVILAANHGGILPFDAAMGIIDVALHTDPPRLARCIVDQWAGKIPWVNIFYSRVGQVIGTRENFADLLDEGQLVVVFPEGLEGATKPISQRYRLQHFRMGFVEQALRARAPIVPTAFIGSDDQAPILYDLKTVARRLGLPALPITPTFPWLGPLGLVPYPVKYRIVYGEPLNFHERFGPEGAEDSRLVRYLANQVRRSVQRLIDHERS